MDAHLFRRYCAALIPRIVGSRMEKIHALDAHVTVFTIYGGPGRDGILKMLSRLKNIVQDQ